MAVARLQSGLARPDMMDWQEGESSSTLPSIPPLSTTPLRLYLCTGISCFTLC